MNGPERPENMPESGDMKIIKAGGEALTTLKDAANYLGVHPNTVRRWADAGILPARRLPTGVRRFHFGELTEFYNQMYLKGVPPTFDINNGAHVQALRELLLREITVEQAGPMFEGDSSSLITVFIDEDTAKIFEPSLSDAA